MNIGLTSKESPVTVYAGASVSAAANAPAIINYPIPAAGVRLMNEDNSLGLSLDVAFGPRHLTQDEVDLNVSNPLLRFSNFGQFSFNNFQTQLTFLAKPMERFIMGIYGHVGLSTNTPTVESNLSPPLCRQILLRFLQKISSVFALPTFNPPARS